MKLLVGPGDGNGGAGGGTWHCCCTEKGGGLGGGAVQSRAEEGQEDDGWSWLRLGAALTQGRQMLWLGDGRLIVGSAAGRSRTSSVSLFWVCQGWLSLCSRCLNGCMQGRAKGSAWCSQRVRHTGVGGLMGAVLCLYIYME